MPERLHDFYVFFKDNLSKISEERNWRKGPELTQAVKEALQASMSNVLCSTITSWKPGPTDTSLCRWRTTEWLLDFSISSHDLRQVGGKIFHSWKPNERFTLWLAVESELNKVKDPARDLVKLCVINSFIKMFVYPKTDRRITNDWLHTVLERCCGPDPTNGDSVEWLFVGLDEESGKLKGYPKVVARRGDNFQVEDKNW